MFQAPSLLTDEGALFQCSTPSFAILGFVLDISDQLQVVSHFIQFSPKTNITKKKRSFF